MRGSIYGHTASRIPPGVMGNYHCEVPGRVRSVNKKLLKPDLSLRTPAIPKASIHDNHMGMTKFKIESDIAYIAIANLLRSWVDDPKGDDKEAVNQARQPPSGTLTMSVTNNFSGSTDSAGDPIFPGANFSRCVPGT